MKYCRGLVAKPSFLLAIVASFLICKTTLQAQPPASKLPPLQVHPLPITLEQWQPQERGEYFSHLVSLPIGALIWTQFPIKVYWDRPVTPDEPTASFQQFQQWVRAVETAIREWDDYLPLVAVPQRENADIVIERDFPPLGSTFNAETGKIEIPRARTAQTRYDLAIGQAQPPILSHRMTVQISPRLSEAAILAAARHELGHALGIWGHSPVETDALYFSQVADTPAISVRDVNTLKKIYQQPTRLGGAIPN
jgi:predicted Zn-dependent protease